MSPLNFPSNLTSIITPRQSISERGPINRNAAWLCGGQFAADKLRAAFNADQSARFAARSRASRARSRLRLPVKSSHRPHSPHRQVSRFSLSEAKLRVDTFGSTVWSQEMIPGVSHQSSPICAFVGAAAFLDGLRRRTISSFCWNSASPVSQQNRPKSKCSNNNKKDKHNQPASVSGGGIMLFQVRPKPGETFPLAATSSFPSPDGQLNVSGFDL